MEIENNFEERKDDSKVFKPYYNNKNNNFSFGKQVIIPFISGIVGSGLVLGTCFAIPDVKNHLFTINQTNSSNLVSNSSNNNADYNTSHISLTNFSETGIAVSQKVLPSVVGIKVEYSVSSIFSRGSSTAVAEGSGVIISKDGYILTNNHIVNTSSDSVFYQVSDASKVSVSLYNDKTEYEATIVGTDEQTDLAVIKINKNDLTAAELGNSDSIQVGEFAMAIGNPLGLQSSVSSGVISAVNRKVTTDGRTYTLIQTDASINSGNSGGALVNSKGQVIGINTLKMAGSGIEGMSFAIPINLTKNISEQLIQYNKVKRPTIGISGRDLDEQIAKKYNLVVGVYILSVGEFSSAEKAGLKIGDVITSIDGTKVTTMNELNDLINRHNIGDNVSLTYFRNGEESTVTVTLQEQ